MVSALFNFFLSFFFFLLNLIVLSMINVRVIQAMIQVVIPTARGVGRVRGMAMELKCMEIYI